MAMPATYVRFIHYISPVLIGARSPAMLSPSPLDYLAAFALTFLSGALLAACHCKYVSKVRQDTRALEREAPVHA